MKTKIAVYGAAGRVGQLLTQKINAIPELVLTAALIKPNDSRVGYDAGLGTSMKPMGISFTDNLEEATQHCDVVIDFSSPAGTKALLPQAMKTNCALVIGTTGFGEETQTLIDNACRHIPILQAANMSIGINAVAQTLHTLSKMLADFDIEMFELHHGRKKDAPSGTGQELARVAAEARGLDPSRDFRYGRHGQVGARGEKELGILSARGGDCIGEHTIFFLGEGERIELTHRATDRGIFAQGAIQAARWIVGKPAGRYTMQDVLAT